MPIIQSFISSTMHWRGGPNRTFIGIENWSRLVSDTHFWSAFGNNIQIMFLSLLFQVPFALLLASFLDSSGRNTRIFKVFWFFPYLLSAVAIGILFRFALAADAGIITSISKLMGGESIDLLGDSSRSLYTIIAVVCWQFTPFYMILYLAGYGTIPVELYEAASIDGASGRQYFWRVSLPLLRPTIISGMILSIIGSLKYFDLIWVMTGGMHGTELMGTYMYRVSFTHQNMGYGATIAS